MRLWPREMEELREGRKEEGGKVTAKPLDYGGRGAVGLGG